MPNRHFVLRRNPRFEGLGIPGIPAGRLASITTEIVKSPARQAQDVIRGDLDYMQDAPPADIKQEVRSRYGDRYKETPVGLHVLLLHEHPGGAVRRPEGARRR